VALIFCFNPGDFFSSINIPINQLKIIQTILKTEKMKGQITLVAVIVLAGPIAITRFSLTEKATANPSEKISLPADDMQGWSEASKMAAMMMKKQYGEPTEKTSEMMMWKNTGQWKKTVVYAKEFKHDFPMPHTDVMQQWIDYKVPPEKFSDLARFDGSVVCNRTNGDISARCDKEGANFLAINLANDIITGKKDVNTARDFYATTVKEMINGGKPAYMQKLQFNVASGNTADTDKPNSIITEDDMMKAKKMNEQMKKEMMNKAVGMDGNDEREKK
jgi:hypothetical protein